MHLTAENAKGECTENTKKGEKGCNGGLFEKPHFVIRNNQERNFHLKLKKCLNI